MTFEEYVRIRAINFSTLKAMALSPLHYHHATTTERADTAAYHRGRTVHSAILEPERFAADYVIYDGTRRGKEWEAFRSAHPGKTIIKPEDHALAVAICAAVRANPQAMAYLDAGAAEQVIQWVDAGTRLACKGRVDWISTARPAIVDLKTARSIDSRQFGNAAARYLYHAQMAFYVDGHAAAHGTLLPAALIAVEAEAPHDVGVFVIDPDEALHAGREVYREWLDRVAECQSVGVWTGRYARETMLALPSYVFDDDPDGIADGIQLEEAAQ